MTKTEEETMPRTRPPWRPLRGVERVARRRADAIAWRLVALGGALRLRAASGTWVSPDEAVVLLISSRDTLPGVLEAGLTNPHPPLVYLLLHYWSALGSDELWLRLLPILFAVAGLAVAWRFARALLGRASGLAAVGFLAASPGAVSSTSDVRAYALLLFFLTAALEALRRATAPEGRRPVPRTTASLSFGLLSTLAIASHYSAVFLLVPMLPWGLVRARRHGLRRPDVARLAAAWSVPAAAFGLFWVGHVSWLRATAFSRAIREQIYAAGHFRSGLESLPEVLARQSLAVAESFGGSRAAGVALLAVGLAGLAFLARRLANELVLVAGALAVSAAVGVLGLYPLVGGRHFTYALVPAALAVGTGFAYLCRRLGLPSAALTAVGTALLAWSALGARHYDIPREAQREEHLEGALGAIGRLDPGRDHLLVDTGSSGILVWYRGDRGHDYWAPAVRTSSTTLLAGLPATIVPEWSFSEETLARAVDDARRGPASASRSIRVLLVAPHPGLRERLLSGKPPLAGARVLPFGDYVFLVAIAPPSRGST